MEKRKNIVGILILVLVLIVLGYLIFTGKQVGI